MELVKNLYTQQDIDNANSNRMFEFHLENQNKRISDFYNFVESETMETLKRYGVNEIPERILTVIQKLFDAKYQHFFVEMASKRLNPGAYVVGPSNYNKVFTPRMQSRSRSMIDKSYGRIDFFKNLLDKEINKHSPKRAISSREPDAIIKLQGKVDLRKVHHTLMKLVNQSIKRTNGNSLKLSEGFKKDLCIAVMDGLEVNSPATRSRLNPNYLGYIGYEPFEFQNNLANIKRLEKRIEELKTKKNTETSEKEIKGIKVVENTELDRLQLIFPDKPDETVRSLLKRNGFKWSPSNGAWQRFLNNASRYSASLVLDNIS